MPAVVDRPGVISPVTRRDDAPTGGGFHGSVVVRDDAAFPVEVVVVAFLKVLPGLTPQRVVALVMEIERRDEAAVWQGPREVCELYGEQLVSWGSREVGENEPFQTEIIDDARVV